MKNRMTQRRQNHIVLATLCLSLCFSCNEASPPTSGLPTEGTGEATTPGLREGLKTGNSFSVGELILAWTTTVSVLIDFDGSENTDLRPWFLTLTGLGATDLREVSDIYLISSDGEERAFTTESVSLEQGGVIQFMGAFGESIN